MSITVERLVALLLAFVVWTNAVDASSLGAHRSACCRDKARSAAAVAAACHAVADSTLATCEAETHPLDTGAFGCGAQCTSCAGHQGSNLAALLMSTASAFVLDAAFERPCLSQRLLPTARPERLERPPSPLF